MSIDGKTFPNLETSRLLLKKLSLKDVEDLFIIYSDEKTTLYVPRKNHTDKSFTNTYLNNRIAKMNEGKSLVWSVVKKDEDKVIGTVDCFFKEDSVASIGSVINSEYWGNGIATEALQQVIQFCFNEIKLIRIEGKCEVHNVASEQVLKKLGMTYEGTLRKEVIINGTSRDVKVYSILDEEYTHYCCRRAP